MLTKIIMVQNKIMKEKIIRKSLFMLNIFLAVIYFFIAVSFFNSNQPAGFILAAILIMLTGGQYYIQQLETLRNKIIATIASIGIFLIVGEIAYRMHV
jgi:hypothetical protein